MPNNPLVDIFIPVCENHRKDLRVSLACALRQTYSPIRVIVYSDGFHPNLESNFKDFWYSNGESPNCPILKAGEIHLEHCSRGILVRHYGDRSNHAQPKKWYYDWPDKGDFVKFLDADDIIFPRTIEIMMRYMTDDTDGVICPLIRYSGGRHSGFCTGSPMQGIAGSGSMLLRRELFEKLKRDGYTWDEKDHDHGFHLFVKDKDYKFACTKEDFLYVYVKD